MLYSVLVQKALQRGDADEVIRIAKTLPNTYTNADEAAVWQRVKTANYQRGMSPLEQAVEKLVGNGILPLEAALNS